MTKYLWTIFLAIQGFAFLAVSPFVSAHDANQCIPAGCLSLMAVPLFCWLESKANRK